MKVPRSPSSPIELFVELLPITQVFNLVEDRLESAVLREGTNGVISLGFRSAAGTTCAAAVWFLALALARAAHRLMLVAVGAILRPGRGKVALAPVAQHVLFPIQIVLLRLVAYFLNASWMDFAP